MRGDHVGSGVEHQFNDLRAGDLALNEITRVRNEYHRLTHDASIRVARLTLVRSISPGLNFGAHTTRIANDISYLPFDLSGGRRGMTRPSGDR